jgi:hypothetical protein
MSCGEAMPLDPDTLSARQREFLAAFRFHPALTPDAVVRLVWPDGSADAVMKVARRLAFRGWTETHRLPDGGVYYVLTWRAAVALGLPKKKRRGLSHDAAVKHLGTLWLCLRLRVQKRSAQDFRAACPELCRRGLPAGDYGVHADDRLVWLVIDHGGTAARLAAKAAAAVAKREQLPAFRELIDASGFGVAVAVPTDAKAAEVAAALTTVTINGSVTVRVQVVPELVPLFLVGD